MTRLLRRIAELEQEVADLKLAVIKAKSGPEPLVQGRNERGGI
jgi:hypothetical protein